MYEKIQIGWSVTMSGATLLCVTRCSLILIPLLWGFGFPVSGNTMWEAINRVFDYMPIAAVIADAIFCAHGGIGNTLFSIEDVSLT
jgi:hypothetical protein